MDWLVLAGGVGLILLALTDLFLTVLHQRADAITSTISYVGMKRSELWLFAAINPARSKRIIALVGLAIDSRVCSFQHELSRLDYFFQFPLDSLVN